MSKSVYALGGFIKIGFRKILAKKGIFVIYTQTQEKNEEISFTISVDFTN